MFREVPVFIDSPSGKLCAIVHYPETERPESWVISLNAGLQCRTGPKRLYVAMARSLVKLGFGVIRVDLPGVGDSEGPDPEIHFDMHMQRSKTVHVVVDYVKSKFQPEKTILQGLCSGARAAIRVAAERDDIDGLLAWSVPILTSGPGMPSTSGSPKYGVSKAVAEESMGRLARVIREAKFLRLSFWRHHLTSAHLGTELKKAAWSAWLLLRNKAPTEVKGVFLQSLFDYLESGRPIQFIYGERDTCEYREFLDLNLDLAEGDFILLPGGTHTFATADQKYHAISGAGEWLVRNFQK